MDSTNQTNLLGVLKDTIQPYVCKAGGDAAIALANGGGVYVKATVVKLAQSSSPTQAAPPVPTGGCQFDTQCKGEDARGDLGFLVLGGRDVGDEDLGYGPARAFTGSAVRAIADALKHVTSDALFAGYDSKSMNAVDIYPGGWPDRLDRDPDLRRYLEERFAQLKELVVTAATRGDALLVFLT